MSDLYDGDNFFTVRNGVRVATPLLLALAVVELSDVAFAVDSIPAVRSLFHFWLLTCQRVFLIWNSQSYAGFEFPKREVYQIAVI